MAICGQASCRKPNCLNVITKVAETVRAQMEKKYGDLEGHCVEVSECIVEELKKLGYENAKTVDGFVKMDDPWEGKDPAHVWVEVPCEDSEDGFLFIDATLDQFNYYMNEPYPKVTVRKGYPYGITLTRPEDEDM